MTVDRQTPPGSPDPYTLERVREALAQNQRVNELELDVKEAAGKIVVTGTVETRERSEAITEVLRELLPGRTILNETTVLTLSEDARVERLP